MLEINNLNQELLYNKLSIKKLEEISSAAGLANCDDIKSFEKNILDISNILDIGSGYGRSIDYLRSLDKDLQITGVELNKVYSENLAKRYKAEDIRIISSSILDVEINGFFDSILMMWCFVYELSDSELSTLLKKLRKMMHKRSYIYVDILAGNNIPSNAKNIQGSIYEVDYGGYTNIKEKSKIISDFENNGFTMTDTTSYYAKDREKNILIFKLK